MSASRTAEVHSRGWTGHIDESLSEQESGQYSQGDSIVYPLSRGLSEPDLSVQYLPCLIVCDRSVRRYLASQACCFNISKKSYAGDNKIDSGDDAPLMTLVNERRALYVLLSIQSRLRTSLEVRRPKLSRLSKIHVLSTLVYAVQQLRSTSTVTITVIADTKSGQTLTAYPSVRCC